MKDEKPKPVPIPAGLPEETKKGIESARRGPSRPWREVLKMSKEVEVELQGQKAMVSPHHAFFFEGLNEFVETTKRYLRDMKVDDGVGDDFVDESRRFFKTFIRWWFVDDFEQRYVDDFTGALGQLLLGPDVKVEY